MSERLPKVMLHLSRKIKFLVTLSSFGAMGHGYQLTKNYEVGLWFGALGMWLWSGPQPSVVVDTASGVK